MVLCFGLSSPVIFRGHLARISVHLQKGFPLRAFHLCSCVGGHILWSYAQNGLLHLSLAVLLSTLLFDCVQKDNSMKCNYLYRHYLEPLREWIRFLSQSTADEIKSFQTTESKGFPEGTHVSAPDEQTGSAIKKCSQAN